MSYVLLDNGTAKRLRCSSFEALLAQYNNMYRYSVYVAAVTVYVVVKHAQPKQWEVGWAS